MVGTAYWPATAADQVREETVGDLLRWATERAPDTHALVEGVANPADRRRWTYAQMLTEAENAARALLGRFAPGERVAVWANNIPEWELLELATALAGMTLVTVNPALRAGELRHVLSHSRSAGIFLLDEYRDNPMAATVDSVRPGLPELRETIRFADWRDFTASGTATQPLPHVRPGDAAQIQYTSGTTGAPKGATLTHRGITNNGRLSWAEVLGLGPGDAQVNPMPMFHTSGCVLAVISAIASLGTHVLMPVFDPALQLELVSSERGVTLAGVPTMLLRILDEPGFEAADLSSVRCATSGGATVPPHLVTHIEKALGVPFTIIYGQTEASPGITMTRTDDSPSDRAHTLGRPLPAVEVRIADANGATVPVDTIGELCTRGYHVMTGYFDDAEQTAAAIDADGWLHTGDLASMDERGYCRIEGRVKDMIIRGGENIYPREIEQALGTHPGVADVAVVGVPDPVWGEQVAAFVRPVAGRRPTQAELHDHVRALLAPHKTPKVWRYVDEFPLTPSGKIQKYVLQARLAAEPS